MKRWVVYVLNIKLNVRQSHGKNRYTFMKYSRGDWNKILKNTQLKKQYKEGKGYNFIKKRSTIIIFFQKDYVKLSKVDIQ